MIAYSLGIDPGKSGALVLLDPRGAVVWARRMPVIARPVAKGWQRHLPAAELRKLPKTAPDYDQVGIRDALRDAADRGRVVATLENPGLIRIGGKAMVTASGSLKACVGLIEGVCAGLGIEVRKVAPATWQAAMSVRGNSDERKALGSMHCGMQWGDVTTKWGDGECDAALIALYGLNENRIMPEVVRG